MNAGALLEAELKAEIADTGFMDFAITWRGEVFIGTLQSSSSADYGTLRINFMVRKPNL